MDENGNKLGRHKGLYAYTIGQRRGLGLAHPFPLYVLGFDLKKNEVIVGEDSRLFKDEITLYDVSFIAGTAPEKDTPCSVKIRYAHKPAKAVLKMTGGNTAKIAFKEPQRAITPGQAAVFYLEDEVLGGGWIEK